uniref:Dystroglycan-type cadherin-like domain-containing protein n=1 Tax=Kwoniella dejecticola CBS 10117 TaxID=1296121 RepID=A0A1A5ZX98_9TREE|nr:uncharacterized protein I303_07193 [Kwoniella dejecticola CBS 10117]OBR82433.1 hypothetical protein I303_07193 [Kwoniella dejecticola CBS 10117]
MLILPSLLALAAFVSSVRAAPTLNFPLNQQQPGVARVNQEFVYELLPATFNSTSSTNLTYTTSTLPSWLSWDSPSLAFHGTPVLEDVGEQDITLTADDGTGSTTSTFTLIVSNYSVPAVHQSFYTQISRPNLHAISSATIMPGGTGVTIPPYWSFSLGFQTDTFRISRQDPNNGQLYYAAHIRGTVGLPSWLKFDNETVTFTGVAPADGSYAVVATGTDFWGYTGAQTSFTIEVGQGQAIEMARNQNLTNAQTMAKNTINQKIDLSAVTIDGNAVNDDDVEISLGSDDYPWLSIDSSTDSLTGTVPDQYQNGTFATISVPVDIRSTNTSNTLYLTTWLGIDVLPYFFSTFSLPNATATLGQGFNFDLSSFLVNKTATVNATVNPSDAASWLSFNPKNMSLHGTAPSTMDYNKVDVVFEAAIGQLVATSTLNVNIPQVSQTTTHTGTAAVPTSGNSGSPGISRGAKIAMGVCLGLLLLVTIILILFFCCCRRKRKNKGPAKRDDDNDSFVATSPVTVNDPFRRSNSLDPPRNLLGEIARFSGLNLKSGEHNEKNTPLSPASLSTDATMVQERPTRLDGLKGIFGWNAKEELNNENEKPAIISPQIPSDSRSFIGYPDVIGVNDPVNRPSQDASSFTQSFISESSRASWQSQESFHWSSVDGEGEDEVASLGAVGGNRISTASSIPRPRPNFTPRYPRHQNPSVLARMVDLDDVGSQASFSEFHSSQEGHRRDSLQSGSNFESGSGTGFDGSSNSMMASGSMFGSNPGTGTGFGSGSSFPAGPSGLSRFEGESGRFKSQHDFTDDEDAFSVEGPAVVAMAERQSFETRRPQRQDSRSHPRLKESRSRHGTGDLVSGMFDDADDQARRSTIYAPSEGGGALQENPGLGYPNSAIYFGSQNGDVEPSEGYTSQRASTAPTAEGSGSGNRGSTIKVIPSKGASPLSPALPQVGSFIRHRRTNTGSAGATSAMMRSPPTGPGNGHTGANDGRVMAVANETFSIHPQINPPPTVSLSAATWSSNPPSTYRAEVEGGGSLPSWLHFDARELELWGVPPLRITGDVTVVRIIERLPRDNRRSDPMSFGYEPPQEREVGRVTIEISDRMRSPQFALEGSPHAL